MSFKKFLAPVMSCCCVVSSLVSHCSANYKYSDLYAVEITDYKGLNRTADIDQLARNNEIVYVSKELENLLKQDNKTCACCQQKMKLSDGFVMGHNKGFFHSYDNWIDNDLGKVLDDTRINDNTKIVKGLLSHLVCEKCAKKAFVENRPLAEKNKPEENGLLRCPLCKDDDEDALGISLRSLKFLGEAISVQRKKDLKETCQTVCNIAKSLAPFVIGVVIAQYIPCQPKVKSLEVYPDDGVYLDY